MSEQVRLIDEGNDPAFDAWRRKNMGNKANGQAGTPEAEAQPEADSSYQTAERPEVNGTDANSVSPVEAAGQAAVMISVEVDPARL